MSTEPIPFVPCRLVDVPTHLVFHAAELAIAHNPANRPQRLGSLLAEAGPIPLASPAVIAYRAAVQTSRYWGPGGCADVPVFFLEQTPQALADKILGHANLIGARGANVQFRQTRVLGDSRIRISREPGHGYASFMGTDNQLAGPNDATMWLESFTLQTIDSEYVRVVPHEFLHFCAFPHELFRKALQDRIDPAKALAYYMQWQGWDERTVRDQVIHTLAESELMTVGEAEDESAMCYAVPGPCCYGGKGIPGGTHLTDRDYATILRACPPVDRPVPVPPIPTPPPAPDGAPILVTIGGPPVALHVPAGGRAHYRLTLPAPTTFTLLCGAIGGTPTVTAGRRGGTLGTSVPLRGGAAAVRAAAGDWEFVVATSAPAGGLVYLRAVPFGSAALRDVAPVEFC
jgi:hypothetical protein